MPAKDAIHDAVRNALIKDGWTITADPYRIQFEETAVYADLAAERVLAAERGTDRIVVESKSFLGGSPVRDFQLALGQYEMYRTLLRLNRDSRRVFLAVPGETYEEHFVVGAIGAVAREASVLVLVVDVEREEVVSWKS